MPPFPDQDGPQQWLQLTALRTEILANSQQFLLQTANWTPENQPLLFPQRQKVAELRNHMLEKLSQEAVTAEGLR